MTKLTTNTRKPVKKYKNGGGAKKKILTSGVLGSFILAQVASRLASKLLARVTQCWKSAACGQGHIFISIIEKSGHCISIAKVDSTARTKPLVNWG
eukprot:3983495-Amphidinium_carterae.1